MSVIVLKSSDDQIFSVERAIAEKSKMIRDMLDLTEAEEGKEIVAPLDVKGATLKKVVEWTTQHKDDPAPVDDLKEKELGKCKKPELSQWDEDFLQLEQAELYDLLLAANYLEIKDLLDVICKTVALMIQDKSAEEIREKFDVKNDFSKAEEEKIKEENEWCADKKK